MLTFAADNLTERGKRLHGTPPAPLADTRRTGHEKAGEHPFFSLPARLRALRAASGKDCRKDYAPFP